MSTVRMVVQSILIGMVCTALFVGGTALMAEERAADKQVPTLPPIPTSIPSVLGPVEVIRVPNLDCGGRALGCYEMETHTIKIRDSIALNVAWQTLYHEEFHMVMADAGIRIPNEDVIADLVGANRVLNLRAQLKLP